MVKNRYFIPAIILLELMAGIYFAFSPACNNFFPKCPFHLLTGFDCPGCGSQRAVHALLHGKIGPAADYNLLLVISLPFLLVHFGYKISGWRSGKARQWRVIYHPLFPKICFIAVVLFWIIRNTPTAIGSYLAA